MKLSEAGAQRIANYEGFRADAYFDIDHWSIGYGTRAKWQAEGPISRAEALRRLRHQVDHVYGKAVNDVPLHTLKLNQNQFDALTSFTFNLGTGILEDDTTIGQCLRAGMFREAADAMLLYDKSNGVALAGLTRRRKEERALFLRKPPIGYSDGERQMLGVLRDKDAPRKRRDRAYKELRAHAHDLQALARRGNDWAIHDRGRRYQGIRRALRKYAPKKEGT